MADRRPPRPAAPRPPAARPASGTLTAGERPRSREVPVRADSDELAMPWRRAPRSRDSRDDDVAARASDAASRVSRGARRGSARGAQAAEQLGNVTLRLQARLREKAAAQRRLSAIVWARRAGYLTAAAFVAWVVLWSPVLALDPAQVEVTGYGTVVDPKDVAPVVRAYEGGSLATLATARLADSLREVPGVRDATIERVWPRGLHISLVSREPVAAVPAGDGGYWFIDADATRVGRSAAAPEALPVVTVPVGDGHRRVLDAVLGVINQLPVELRDRVRDISATTEDTVTFQLRSGPRVEWGSAEASPLKAEVLRVLLDSAQGEDASVIDVSAPTLPTTKE